MILKPFSAILIRSLAKDSYDLPLAEGDRARLLAQLPEGESTLLVLRDDIYEEEIEVSNTCGQPLISARGLGESEIRKFPRGSSVCFQVTVSVVQHLVCNYDCCDGPPPVSALEAVGVIFPTGHIDEAWMGSAIFAGELPMTLAVEGNPSWMQVEAGPNYVRFSGTPTGAGTYTLSIAATNQKGSQLVVQSGEVTVV
jgi:hypothetical protein